MNTPKSMFATSTKVAVAQDATSALFEKTHSQLAKVEATSGPIIDIISTVVDTPEVDALSQKFDLGKVEGQEIVLFGSERQKAIGAKLDDILTEITKGGSPVLYELFNELKKGVEAADLPALELKIREAQKSTGFQRFMKTIGFDNTVKRLQKANEEVELILASKSKSLVSLTKQMEEKLSLEVSRLITDSSKLARLAIEYRKNVIDFEFLVRAGRKILENAKTESVRRKNLADSTRDTLTIEDSKLFDQKLSLFENRLVTLETILVKAPSELESIYLSQGASLQVLGETASSSLEEFNDIKSALIRLSVNHQIGSLQTINSERRSLRDSLTKYGTDTLENVAVKAAQAQGLNRLEDATKLLENATRLKDISAKVMSETQANKQRFAEARAKLLESKKLIETR